MGNKSWLFNRRLDQQSFPWGSSTSDGYFEVKQVYYVRSASDNPKFPNAIAAHSNATNPMLVDSHSIEYEAGELIAKIVNPASPSYGKTMTTRRLMNAIPYAVLPNAGLQSSASNKALIGIYKKARESMQSGFSGPTFLVELKELVQTIRNPFSTLRKQTLRLIDKRVKNPRPTKNFVSDSFLEYTYGVAPSIGDITEIAHLINEKLSKRSEGHRLSFRYTESTSNDWVHSFRPTGFIGDVYTVNRGKYFASTQYIIWIDPGFQGLNSFVIPASNLITFGKFDLGEVLPTIWEGIPWSFLLDYVTNIGDLAACTYDLNSYVRWVCKTDRLLGTQEGVSASTRNVDTSFNTVSGLKGPKWKTAIKRVNRTAPSELGFPRFEFSLPNLGQIHNSAQLLIAQLSQQSTKWR